MESVLMFKIRKSNESFSILFGVSALISFIMTIFSESFVPEQFTRDSKYIQLRLETRTTGYTDSFQVMVNFYSKLGIDKPNILLRLIEWLIFYAILLLARKFYTEYRNTLGITFISCFYLVLIPFYGSLFTKEILMSIFIGIFLVIRLTSNRFPFLMYAILISIFAISIRNYYFLTLLFFTLYRIINLKWSKSFFDWVFPIIFLSLFATLDSLTSLSAALTGRNIFNIRLDLQTGLRVNVNSLVEQSFLGNNYISNILVYLDVLMQFLVPWRIIDGNIYSIIVFLIVTCLVLLIVYPYLRRPDPPSYEALFLFSYFSVSLIFEPDLGSFVRHTFPFIPLVVIATCHRWNENNLLQNPLGRTRLAT